jgi:hypothetical protein
MMTQKSPDDSPSLAKSQSVSFAIHNKDRLKINLIRSPVTQTASERDE